MLSDLVSGKSSKDDIEDISPAVPTDTETGAATDNETARIENAAPEKDEKPKAVNSQAAAVIATDKAKPVAGADPVHNPAIDEDKPVEIAAPAPVSTPDQRPLSKPRPKSPAATNAKRPAPQSKSVTAAPIVASASEEKSTADLPAASVAKPEPKSALDDMAELDREIEDLRQRLAEKLTRQNAQLRKLIDRYDGR
jgi:hypothetical protein